jgi:hypothetical protein
MMFNSPPWLSAFDTTNTTLYDKFVVECVLQKTRCFNLCNIITDMSAGFCDYSGFTHHLSYHDITKISLKVTSKQL